MNGLTIMNSNVQTMTSKEIADLAGKRHDNTMEVCRDLLAKNVTPEIQESTFNHNGNTYPCYILNKRDSYVLMARLSPEFTGKLVDRWTELETVVQAIADENHVTKEQLVQEKLNAQFAKAKAMKEAANLRIEALRAKHKQTMAILEAKTTKLLSQGAKVKGDMSVGKLTMPKSTVTNLLKEHGSHIEPRDANFALVNLGYLESDRKTVTNHGSEYGTSNKSGNGKALQAFWFDSEFVRLLEQIEKELYDLGIIDADGNYSE